MTTERRRKKKKVEEQQSVSDVASNFGAGLGTTSLGRDLAQGREGDTELAMRILATAKFQRTQMQRREETISTFVRHYSSVTYSSLF